MTAEIAIMNRQSVALAADSAGTTGSKVYTSVNKLFTLSKYHPVGIMFYGNSSLLGVPWETIVKIYRNRSAKRRFDSLESYADDLISFLDSNQFLFPEEQQQKYFYSLTYFCFKDLVAKIKKESDRLRLVAIEDKELREMKEEFYLNYSLNKVLIDEEKKLKEYVGEICTINPEKNINTIIDAYGQIISDIKEELFKEFSTIDEEISKRLERIASYSYYKGNITGVVIAGFGEKDIFPSLVSYIVTGIIDNKLIIRKNEKKSSKITFENRAEIFSFAISDVIDTFLYGIDPSFKKLIKQVFERVLEEYPEKTFNHFVKVLEKETGDKNLIKKMKDGYDELKAEEKPEFDELMKKFLEAAGELNMKPINDAVTVLPKDEMATMAEFLLKLTSLKQRFSMGYQESVGGLIDVAVISKVDGFVWIKRKHYFDSDLNRQFFDKYFLEDEDYEEKNKNNKYLEKIKRIVR